MIFVIVFIIIYPQLIPSFNHTLNAIFNIFILFLYITQQRNMMEMIPMMQKKMILILTVYGDLWR